MRVFGAALYAEGPTDYRFLTPVLTNLCKDLLTRCGQEAIEIQDLLHLHAPSSAREARREIKVLQAVREASIQFDVLFIHSDGGGDPEAVLRDQIEPSRISLRTECPRWRGKTVPVIPVRETEAWAIADGEALRKVFGCSRSDPDLGLPSNSRAVERILDPKRTFHEACLAASPYLRRRNRHPAEYLEGIGEFLRLERLRSVPAFLRMGGVLKDVLRELGFLRADG